MLDRNVIMQWGSVLSATGSLVETGCLRDPTDMWVKCEVLVTAGTMHGPGCNSLAKQALDKCLRLSGVRHPACWCQNQQKTRRWWLHSHGPEAGWKLTVLVPGGVPALSEIPRLLKGPCGTWGVSRTVLEQDGWHTMPLARLLRVTMVVAPS